MRKILITGISGFAGSHLAELLATDQNNQIFGTYISDRSLDNLSEVKDHVKLSKINLLETEAVKNLIAEVAPDVIYHLAAVTSVAESYKKPTEVITNNTAAEVAIFEAVRAQNLLNTRILLTSSAHVYGAVSPEHLPIDENTPLKPDSPYSVSKITQDFLGMSYYLGYKLPIIIVRPFNHAGARLSPDISLSRFAKVIAEIEKGKQEPVMRVGNLTTKRDYTDVHDMVRAYVLAVDKCNPGEAYNIGSGTSYVMKELLDKLIALARTQITVVSDVTLFRPSDIPELRCNPTKFQQATGWKPEIPIEQTLENTLDYWRKVV